MNKKELETLLNEWTVKVLKTYGTAGDTYDMIKDVDEILAAAFDHDSIL